MIQPLHEGGTFCVLTLYQWYASQLSGGGGLHLKPPKFEHIFVAVITFCSLSSVQILLIPTCCLLCVL